MHRERSLTDTEKRHSQTEKDMLIIVFFLTRFHTYTYGREVTFYNHYRPLAAVLKKPVENNPVRLQRMICRIMGCDVEFKYVKKAKTSLLLMPWTDLKWTTKPKQDRISDWNDKTDSWRSELNKLRAEIAEATAQDTELQSYSWIWVDEKPNCRWNHRSDAKPVCEMGNSRLLQTAERTTTHAVEF